MHNSISKYITGVAAKRLKSVEINREVSNQHELNGSNALKRILGTEKKQFQTEYLLLADNDNEILTSSGLTSWYDSREKKPHRSSEFRLYYQSNTVFQKSSVGDLILVIKKSADELLICLTPKDSTYETQILWLFGLTEIEEKFVTKNLSSEKQSLGYAAKYILSELGIEVDEEDNYLDLILQKFGDVFPSTSVFSEFARSTLKDTSPVEDPDETLLRWMEREETLFKTLEKHIVFKKLSSGFGSEKDSVDNFIQFSLSVHNRRKARAGFAFENHLSVIFDAFEVNYSSGKVTELNKKPDFIFPNIASYHDLTFDTRLLSMLGVKTTAKDRWRQILSEASKISQKHLITLEPAISRNQTEEMFDANLGLIIPRGIQSTYSEDQRKKILSLKSFLDFLLERQNLRLTL